MSPLIRHATHIVILGCALTWPTSAAAHRRRPAARFELRGPYVTTAIEVDGRRVSLYAAPDGSGRYYFEAARGARYAVHLENRSAERIGVRLAVDGLNVIDGGEVARGGTGPGRMYVLAPRARISVRGWRSSLQNVHRFTFVDEERSYAARTGQANGKLGWVELTVYRERPRPAVRPLGEGARTTTDRAEPRAPEPGRSANDKSAAAEGFPGTGWGERVHDPARLVAFDPEPVPVQTNALRYEYHAGLVALGVLPVPTPRCDRLAQRERAVYRFAPPPPPDR